MFGDALVWLLCFFDIIILLIQKKAVPLRAQFGEEGFVVKPILPNGEYISSAEVVQRLC